MYRFTPYGAVGGTSPERHYRTVGGVSVTRRSEPVDADAAVDELLSTLDERRGVFLSSGIEAPGRYSRWDLGFVDPPLAFVGRGRSFELSALNERGRVLLPRFHQALLALDALEHLEWERGACIVGRVQQPHRRFVEEERSRQPSIFSVIRVMRNVLFSRDDCHLGFYGAFGYDLCFQFEPIALRQPRDTNARDLVLYLPDNLIVVDRQRERAARWLYDFEVDGQQTHALPRTGARHPYQHASEASATCDHAPHAYAAAVRRAQEAFKRGDLFELVLSQTFREYCVDSPAAVFRALRHTNPAPYAFLVNLGDAEYLAGASPEMYVRVEGSRVETCPISGTVPRGRTPLEDSKQIQALLSSGKEESELTMCTDVDRNDKSRICEPGTVQVIGRRQIELYSRLIHTVDHVEGTLRPQYDALDAFLSHTWAVTVTGAPKPAAIAAIEAEEKSARAWYGGAVGVIGCNGNLNTGLTLRTVRFTEGIAEIRVGATLLYDSDPEAEEAETRLKASAFLDVVRGRQASWTRLEAAAYDAGAGVKVLLIDHEDSFVHTVANYLRRVGADVITMRWDAAPLELSSLHPDLVVLSPGPGRPRDFKLLETIQRALDRELPVFGVCLGLQAIVEYFGGELDLLQHPMHGKVSRIDHNGSALFRGIGSPFEAGRYHSLIARRETLSDCLEVTAWADGDVVMGVQHRELPIAAVQFHPESIMTASEDAGLKLLNNAIRWFRSRVATPYERSAWRDAPSAPHVGPSYGE